MRRMQKQRKVFITGGTGSVGKALVQAFSSNGDRVTFQFHRDKATANRLQRQFSAEALQLNFEKPFNLTKCDYDIVVNNAGINISDVATHLVTDADWNRTIQVNLTAPFQIVRQCLPSMIRKRWGRIINISSIYGLRATEGNFPYTVSKHGLSGFTKTIAREYAPYGITCNEICPGPIDSQMMKSIAKRSTKRYGGTIKSYMKDVCSDIPANRLLEPHELSALAVFLSSANAAYLTGASIPMDGGMIT